MCRPRLILPDSIKLWSDSAGEPIAVVESTTRVTQGRFLLRPDPRARALILGVLGRAQTMFKFELYGYAFLSNHYSLLLGVRDSKTLGDVMRYINGNIAKELGKHKAWEGPFWARRHRAIPVLDDLAVEERFRYLLGNSTKENLVKRPQLWPGAHCARALCTGRADVGIWVDRSELYRRRRAQAARKDGGVWVHEREVETRYKVTLSPLPCWKKQSTLERQIRVEMMCKELANEAKQARATSGKKVMGATRLQRINPHDKPSHFLPSNAPFSHGDTHLRRKAFREEYNLILGAYLSAKKGLKRGIGRYDFPSACYPVV